MSNEITQQEAGAVTKVRTHDYQSDEAFVADLRAGQIDNFGLMARNLAIIVVLLAIGPLAPKLINLIPDFPYQHALAITLYVLALGVPLAQAAYAAVWTATFRVVVTTQRIDIYCGVLNRKHNTIELFRIRDFAVNQPIVMRLFRRGTLTLWVTDQDEPKLVVPAISKPNEMMEVVRTLAVRSRNMHGVRLVE